MQKMLHGELIVCKKISFPLNNQSVNRRTESSNDTALSVWWIVDLLLWIRKQTPFVCLGVPRWTEIEKVWSLMGIQTPTFCRKSSLSFDTPTTIDKSSRTKAMQVRTQTAKLNFESNKMSNYRIILCTVLDLSPNEFFTFPKINKGLCG